MNLTVPQWVERVKYIFNQEIEQKIPQARYYTEVNDYKVRFNIFVGERNDFCITSSMELLETRFMEKFTNLTILQYPEEEFRESISEILIWVKKYYSGEIRVSTKRTKILKKEFLSLTDEFSSESWEFRSE